MINYWVLILGVNKQLWKINKWYIDDHSSHSMYDRTSWKRENKNKKYLVGMLTTKGGILITIKFVVIEPFFGE